MRWIVELSSEADHALGSSALPEHRCACATSDRGIYGFWSQTTAELLALNYMLEHDAGQRGRKLPVFGGDLNQHLIAHHGSPTEIHCAATRDGSQANRQIAVSCMRHLLQAGVAALKELPGKASALQGMAMRLCCCVPAVLIGV